MVTIPFSSAKTYENTPMEDIFSIDKTTKAATDIEQLITEIKVNSKHARTWLIPSET